MFFDNTLEALVTLLKQPIAVASLILLAGINAAIWLLVFERVGVPTVLASLLIVPPLTFVLPLYVALARWPGQGTVRLPTRTSITRVRTPKRNGPRRPSLHPVPPAHGHRLPLILDSDGLPRVRIPLPPSLYAHGWPDQRGLGTR